MGTVIVSGIYEKGYGMIPKSVMIRKDISAGAKLFYSYICSFAGADGEAFPSVKRISEELGMSERKIYASKKELEDLKLISVRKERKGSKYTNNIYTIIVDYEEVKEETECYENLSLENEPSQNEHVQNEPVQNEPCPNVSTTNNNITNKKNIKKDFKLSAEEIWSIYPNKKGRAKSLNKIPKILKKISKEELIRAVKRYSYEVRDKDKQYIMNGSTFFNGRFEDYLDSNFKDEVIENTNEIKVKEEYIFDLQEDM